MADPQPPSRASDNSTRLDINVGDLRAARRPPEGDLESVEIPIHITGSDLIPVSGASPASGGAGEYVEEMPTEIFRPGMHPYPPPRPMSARSPSATRVAPAPQPGQQRRPPVTNPARAQQPRQPPALPPPPAPVSFEGLGGDDWDGETVVRQPAALTTSKHRERPGREPPRSQPQGRPAPPAQKPFNPDETVNLNGGDIDVDIEFSDETQHIAAPPRRPR